AHAAAHPPDRGRGTAPGVLHPGAGRAAAGGGAARGPGGVGAVQHHRAVRRPAGHRRRTGGLDAQAPAAAPDACPHRPAVRPLHRPRRPRAHRRGLAAVGRGVPRLAARGAQPHDVHPHPGQRRRAGARPPLPRRGAGRPARPGAAPGAAARRPAHALLTGAQGDVRPPPLRVSAGHGRIRGARVRIAPGELRARGGDRARRELRRRWARLAATAPAILQCAVAAGLAWLVAAELLGHPRPFFAPVAAVICIGVAAGRRLPRLVELVAGVSLGVGVGDLLVLRIGSGAWQIALVVALAMAVAVFLGSGTVLTIQAASSAVLVATLLPPTGSGGLHRMIDTFVGGVLGIVAVALLPPDLVAATRRDAREIFDALADTLTETARGMAERDAARVSAVLDEARAGQRAFARFTAGLTAAQEVASISPLRRR